MEEDKEKKEAPKEVVAEPRKSFAPRTSTVRIVSGNVINGKVAVYNPENRGKIWLVPAGKVTNSVKPQEVDSALLEETVYDWKEEIDALIAIYPTLSREEALWWLVYLGYYKKGPFDMLSVQKELERYGAVPRAKKG